VDQWQNAYDSLKQEGIIEEICKKWGIDVPEYKIPSLETKSEN
jgi:ABC-type amino acid transport substrate-binding protein